MWKETEKNIGQINIGDKLTIDFEYDGTLTINKNIFGRQDIVVSCGCTSAKWIPNLNKLLVEFTAPDIPQHLKQMGIKEWAVRKTINIGYIEDNKIVRKILGFTAIIK